MSALPIRDEGPAASTRPPAPELQPSYDPPRTTCVLCGGSELHEHDHDHRGHRFVRCGSCGARFMNPQYTDRWLEHYYSTYIPVTGHSHARGWRARPEVRRQGKTRALLSIQAYVPHGRILMVGCGDGLELKIARELGYDVVGIDVGEETTARVAAECGVPVLCGEFPALTEPDGSFDAIFMDQVIEHPKQPGAFLDKAHRLLRPGGVLYLGQPNIGSLANGWKTLLGRLGLRRRRRGRHYASQHHITYYTPAVLRRHLQGHYDFEVLAVRGSPKASKLGLFDWLTRRFPVLDSSFAILARRR